jgi:hypothetical protein
LTLLACLSQSAMNDYIPCFETRNAQHIPQHMPQQRAFVGAQHLEADLQRSRVSRNNFELMRSIECPLGFADLDEYKAFKSELCCHISIQLFELFDKTFARHHEPSLNGSWVILGGNAATFYSEGRFLDVDPVAGSNCELAYLTSVLVDDITKS